MVFDGVAKLPWRWWCVAAVLAYVGLHWYALPHAVPWAVMRYGVHGAGISWLQMLLMLVQYGVPTLFLAGALVSWIAYYQRQRWLLNVARDHTGQVLDQMSWRDFELLVGQMFRMHGYAVMDNAGVGPDGGVDVVVRKEGVVSLVQCKHWRVQKVSVHVVRELLGVMTAQGAQGGFVVTSGVFTEAAYEFAQGTNVQLMDRVKLMQWIAAADVQVTASRPSPNKPQASRHAHAADHEGGAAHRPAQALASPKRERSTQGSEAAHNSHACPVCGSAMVMRASQKGGNAGRRFWGCIHFPQCHGVREMT